MASWIPGPSAPSGPIDWEAYRLSIASLAEQEAVKAAAEEPKRRRNTKESNDG